MKIIKTSNTPTPELLHKMDAYWRAANYLSVGQIYLYDNPLLKRPLTLADVKHMLLGHWGTTPGQNFVYVHLNRVIEKYDLDMIYVSGPGHGGPAVVGDGEAETGPPATAVEQIKKIQQDARWLKDEGRRMKDEKKTTDSNDSSFKRPRWPMIVLVSPKGWTGPKVVDGLQVEGTFRAHQVPLHPNAHPEHLSLLDDWLRSYRPEELFDAQGRLNAELAELAPKGARRMGANPHANGGMLLRDLRMPDFRGYAADVLAPGAPGIGDTHVLGPFLRDVAKLNQEQRNFRVFGPDETISNGLAALFETTQRQWDAATMPNRFDVQPARQVADSHGATAVAAQDRLVKLPAGRPMSGARITTASPTRTLGSSTKS